jgi:hypothetical protein
MLDGQMWQILEIEQESAQKSEGKNGTPQNPCTFFVLAILVVKSAIKSVAKSSNLMQISASTGKNTRAKYKKIWRSPAKAVALCSRQSTSRGGAIGSSLGS